MVLCTPYFWILFPTTPFMFCCNGQACRPGQSHDSRPPRPPPGQLNTN